MLRGLRSVQTSFLKARSISAVPKRTFTVSGRFVETAKMTEADRTQLNNGPRDFRDYVRHEEFFNNFETGKTEEALSTFQTIKKNNDASAISSQVYDLALQILADTKRVDDAVTLAREVISLGKANKSTYFAVESVLAQAGRAKEAAEFAAQRRSAFPFSV